MKNDLELEVKVDTSNVEKALKKLEKAIDAVSKKAIVINIQRAKEKKWWQLWK